MDKPIPEKRKQYLIALGRITVNMNSLEQWTRVYLAQLMDANFDFVFQHYPTERYAKILEVFDLVFNCKITDHKLKKEFSSILGKLTSLYQRRNTFIHSWWIFAADDSFALRIKNLKGMKAEHDTQPSVSNLNQLADDLSSAEDELAAFINKVAPLKK